MTNSALSQKHALECLRLAADCAQLSGSVSSPTLRSHFVRMSKVWNDLADQAPSELATAVRPAAKECAA